MADEERCNQQTAETRAREQASTRSRVNTRLASTTEDRQKWQRYVDALSEPSPYHHWGWKQVIEEAFGLPTYYLMVEAEGRIVGVFPLVWRKSWLFASFLTSLAFLSGGAAAAGSPAVEEDLAQ